MRTCYLLATILLACEPERKPIDIHWLEPQQDMASPAPVCLDQAVWALDCQKHCVPASADINGVSFGVIQCFRDHGILFNFGQGMEPTPLGYTVDLDACSGKQSVRFWNLYQASQPTEDKAYVDASCVSNYSAYILPPRPYYYVPKEILLSGAN